MYRSFFKRAIDLIISFIVLVLISPLFLILLFLFTVINRGNPFFLQRRPGKNARLFVLIKFKTMADKYDSDGNLLPDEMRMTKTGALMRKTSLDEIPQLINVLKGDMSLIGPRPLLIEYLPLYNEKQAKRHDLRPGITGWAQVNGRNAISWEQKFDYDVWYVENLSCKLDLKILIRTFSTMIKSEGISSDTAITMEKFTGNQ